VFRFGFCPCAKTPLQKIKGAASKKESCALVIWCVKFANLYKKPNERLYTSADGLGIFL